MSENTKKNIQFNMEPSYEPEVRRESLKSKSILQNGTPRYNNNNNNNTTNNNNNQSFMN